MEFIYDFTDGHTVFSYVSKENEALDTESPDHRSAAGQSVEICFRFL